MKSGNAVQKNKQRVISFPLESNSLVTHLQVMSPGVATERSQRFITDPGP